MPLHTIGYHLILCSLSQSNQEDEEDLHESEFESEEDVSMGINSLSALNSMNAMNRIKLEDIKEQREDILARFKQQQLNEKEREEIERQFKSTRASQEELIANFQRQMAAANVLVSGLPAAHFAGLAASVVSSSGEGIPLNTISSGNASNMIPTSTLISSSSPSGASGSSGPSSSPAIQSIEAGKGYTFEEQFKQVSLARSIRIG